MPDSPMLVIVSYTRCIRQVIQTDALRQLQFRFPWECICRRSPSTKPLESLHSAIRSVEIQPGGHGVFLCCQAAAARGAGGDRDPSGVLAPLTSRLYTGKLQIPAPLPSIPLLPLRHTARQPWSHAVPSLGKVSASSSGRVGDVVFCCISCLF